MVSFERCTDLVSVSSTKRGCFSLGRLPPLDPNPFSNDLIDSRAGLPGED
jgi:hypothetical protein